MTTSSSLPRIGRVKPTDCSTGRYSHSAASLSDSACKRKSRDAQKESISAKIERIPSPSRGAKVSRSFDQSPVPGQIALTKQKALTTEQSDFDPMRRRVGDMGQTDEKIGVQKETMTLIGRRGRGRRRLVDDQRREVPIGRRVAREEGRRAGAASGGGRDDLVELRVEIEPETILVQIEQIVIVPNALKSMIDAEKRNRTTTCEGKQVRKMNGKNELFQNFFNCT